MDANRITGAVDEIAGRVQSAAGDAFGSDHDSIEGRFRTAHGIAENRVGQARDAVREQPFLALALAGLTGYALALALHGRS